MVLSGVNTYAIRRCLAMWVKKIQSPRMSFFYFLSCLFRPLEILKIVHEAEVDHTVLARLECRLSNSLSSFSPLVGALPSALVSARYQKRQGTPPAFRSSVVHLLYLSALST